jgi:hypothetical protein
MLGNAFLDIAIGLVMMFLVLSLVCTTINEFIATFMRLRANFLKQGLERILDEPDVYKAFYDNGLIRSMLPKQGKHFSYLSGSTFALAILQSLGDPSKPLKQIDDVKTAIDKLDDSDLKKMLIAQITSGQDSIDKLRSEIATWFDGAMDRVTGVYQRRIKIISLVVGLVLAIGLNVDSITVARALWNDDSLRAQMVQQAQAYIAQATAPPAAGAPPRDVPLSEVSKKLKGAQDELRPLPIGWDKSVKDLAWHDWISKVAGWLFTAAALSLGAPFWFDLLSKFMNVRGGGGKPEREEEKKDKK